MKIASTKQRIIEYLNFKDISKANFFKKTLIKRGFLDADKLKSSVSDIFVAIIIATYPELNLEWLITGNGEMLKKDTPIYKVSEKKTNTGPVCKETALENKYLKKEVDSLQKLIDEKDKVIKLLENAQTHKKTHAKHTL